ncbi:MAG: aldo/keto reductase [Lachnospiraceae bacterium]|nr:aldo/keto reductase [Lachnospiraceae bacterium]
MKTISIGDLGKPVSRIGLGTWAIGGGPAWGGDKSEAASIDTIRRCPGLGVNLIDTAPGYNFGKSEEIVGKALAGMDRESVAVITKFGIVWKREGALFNKVGDVQLYKNLSTQSILEEIDDSLARLGCGYIDIYMSHWQAVEPYPTPIGETMELLGNLKAKGKIRGIGAANVTVSEVEEYVKYGQLDIVQAKYSVLDREVEKEMLPLCKEKGIVLQAYSPLEMGLLSGAIGRGYQPVGAQQGKKWFSPENLPKAMDFLDGLAPFCEKYGCKTADMALAWLLAQGENVILLSGATTPAQIGDNAKADAIGLTKEDSAAIRELAQDCEAGR